MTTEASRDTAPVALITRALLVVALVALLCYIVDVLLLVFAAVLLAILVRVPTEWLIERVGLRASFAFSITIACLVALVALAGWLLGAAVSGQVQQLSEQLPQALATLRERVPQSEWMPDALSNPISLLQSNEGRWLGRSLSAISTTFGAVANIAIIVLMAFFFALQPDLYVRGVVRLAPIEKRRRVREVLHELSRTLRHWLGGQLVLMLLVAVLTGLGLSLIGVRYALALGMLAGLLTFIPFLGPVLSAIPAILVGIAQGPTTALYVGLLYAGVQAMENSLEPVVQQKAVYLPPALLLFGQIALGVLVGVLGIILATPLTAVAMVLTQMLYVEDVLGDRGS